VVSWALNRLDVPIGPARLAGSSAIPERTRLRAKIPTLAISHGGESEMPIRSTLKELCEAYLGKQEGMDLVYMGKVGTVSIGLQI
jgi:hypothetical protein